MKLIYVAALSLLLPQEKNEAEELFRKMEAKFEAAKTIAVTAKGVMESRGDQIEVTSSLLIGEENRARFEFTMKHGARTVSASAVSDGRKLARHTIDGKDLPPYAVPEKYGRLLRVRLSRTGVTGAIEVFQIEKLAKEDPADSAGASDFTLGEKEKVRDRDSRQVRFKVTKKGEPDRQASVWIDLATHLPLKRELKLATTSVTEEFTQFELDGKIDPAKFELPKEAK